MYSSDPRNPFCLWLEIAGPRLSHSKRLLQSSKLSIKLIILVFSEFVKAIWRIRSNPLTTELSENRWFDNLTLGGRYNKITKDEYVFSGALDLNDSLAGYNGAVSGFPNPPAQVVELTEFTGRAILDKKFENGTLLYLKDW